MNDANSVYIDDAVNDANSIYIDDAVNDANFIYIDSKTRQLLRTFKMAKACIKPIKDEP